MDRPLQHIIVRGIERKKISQDEVDRNNFLERLGKVLTMSGTRRFAWALFPNHAYLLLRTGKIPLPTVMWRLLTDYAVTYNHRHRRHGQLFQNQYKSILGQQDPYLLEMLWYIHLNPIRAGLFPDMKGLSNYPYAGLGAILGKKRNSWQGIYSDLGYFDENIFLARRKYRDFVAEGIHRGRRPEIRYGKDEDGCCPEWRGGSSARRILKETNNCSFLEFCPDELLGRPSGQDSAIALTYRRSMVQIHYRLPVITRGCRLILAALFYLVS